MSREQPPPVEQGLQNVELSIERLATSIEALTMEVQVGLARLADALGDLARASERP